MTHYGDTMSWKEEADALREQLAAERKRREEVEDLWHEEQQAHTAAVTRAEQAERERDEARRDKRDMGGIISRTMDALEGDPDDNMVGLARARMGDLKRAEADNAALAARLQAVCDAAMKSDWMGKNGEREARFPWDEVEFALRDLHAKHPGAEMLERMRALEVKTQMTAAAQEVRDALSDPRLTLIGPRVPTDDALQRLNRALAAYDALKPT